MPSNATENGPSQNHISSFNSPIGYSKHPSLYKSNPRTFISFNELKELSPFESRSGTNGLSIDQLPFEIRSKISNELSQFDCFNLLRSNKAMYLSTIARLYQHIIIDQDFSPFSKEYGYKFYESIKDFNDYKEFSCSYIKSSYNFKKFLHNYIQLYDSRVNDNYYQSGATDYSFPFIKKIQCICLPDSLNTYEYELNDNLSEFFSRLPHLRELTWLNDNFRLELLEMLPNNQSITTLILNIKFSNYLSELNSPSNSYMSDDDEPEKRTLNFPNLINFQIRPFQNSKKLSKIVNNLLVSSNPKRISENLKVLKLSRLDKDVSVLAPSCYDLITASDNIQVLNDIDLRTIDSIFFNSKLTYLNNLTTLSLDNCLVTPDDANTLIDSVNLSNLATLELKNISEHQHIIETVNRSELINFLKPSFLITIAPYLSNLQHLHIDYREVIVDSVPNFLNMVSTTMLESLDLVVRYNETKLQSFNNMESFYDTYSDAIISGNRSTTLKNLSVDIKEENPFCDIDIPIISNNFFKQISKCSNLQSLRMNPSNKSNSLIELIEKLPKLSKLDVFGAKAGGSPNLGLGMIHPSIYDEWFKVQHVAILYLEHNLNLNYIRINKCIFECDGRKLQITPRDGIDRWFNQFVRVDCL